MLEPGLAGTLARIRAIAIFAMFLVAVSLGAPDTVSAGVECEDDLVQCFNDVDECLDETEGPDECHAFGQQECPGNYICAPHEDCHENNPYGAVCSVDEF